MRDHVVNVYREYDESARRRRLACAALIVFACTRARSLDARRGCLR